MGRSRPIRSKRTNHFSERIDSDSESEKDSLSTAQMTLADSFQTSYDLPIIYDEI